MRKLMPSGELARDDRFVRITMEDVIFDPRNAFVATRRRENGFDPRVAEAPDSARGLMHGIFVGEIQALEGAGRTCWDFETGSGEGGVPFELKLDMARQCWDEARHVEISVQALRAHGHRDRRVRRADAALRGGVQRRPGPAPHRREPGARGPGHRRVQHDARLRRRLRRPGPLLLRGLDAGRRGHPREDGLRLAAPPHRQRPRAPASRRSTSSARSTSCSASAASAARKRRTRSTWPASSAAWPASPTTRSASWSTSPPRPTPRRRRRPKRPPPAARATPDPPCTRSSCSTSTRVGRGSSSSATGSPARGRSRANWLECAAHPRAVVVHRVVELAIFVQVALGVAWSAAGLVAPQFHMFYGFVAIIAVGIIYSYRAQLAQPALPALRLRRPVPDGPRHPRHARRPHLTGAPLAALRG